MDLVKVLSEQQLKSDLPALKIGDTVKVHAKIKEGNRERIQVFEGIIIAKKHAGVNQTGYRSPHLLRRRRREDLPGTFPERCQVRGCPQR